MSHFEEAIEKLRAAVTVLDELREPDGPYVESMRTDGASHVEIKEELGSLAELSEDLTGVAEDLEAEEEEEDDDAPPDAEEEADDD